MKRRLQGILSKSGKESVNQPVVTPAEEGTPTEPERSEVKIDEQPSSLDSNEDPAPVKGFASLPFEIYERIFSFLRTSYIEERALAYNTTEEEPPQLPIGALSALPLICRTAYPAGQAALLHTLSIPRIASSFAEYVSMHPAATRGVTHLRIEDGRYTRPSSTSVKTNNLYWLDRPRVFGPLLALLPKLESVHIDLRPGAPAWEVEFGQNKPFTLPSTCGFLSIGKSRSTASSTSLLDSLSLMYRVHAPTVRFECSTSEDLTSSAATNGNGQARRRFVSADHIIIDVRRDNPNVYHPAQFADFLASWETFPRALTIRKMRLDSAAFRSIVQHCGPSLEYLHFTWSTPASSTGESDEVIDYLYGGRYNPLIVGTVLLPGRNLREVEIDIVDAVPLRGMRFPSSVRKVTLQWWTSRHFFTDFFPWLQNHLCTDSPELDTLVIDIRPNWAARQTHHDPDNTRRAESELTQLLDDFRIAKAATELCDVHEIKTKPANLAEAWKRVRRAELPTEVWQDVCRRLGPEEMKIRETEQAGQ